MSFLKTIILCVSIIVILPSLLIAEDVIIPIGHYPPWGIVNKESKATGINVDISIKLLKKLKLTPVFVVRPWKRCQLMMKKGTADMMSGLLKRPDREKDMVYIDPPYKIKSSKAFYVRKGEAGRINQYEDLAKLTIGTTLGTKYFTRFDNDLILKKEIVNDNTINLKKLTAGRIDTFVSTETITDYLIVENEMTHQVEKSNYIYEKPIPVYYAVSKKSPLAKRAPEIAKALKEMLKNGEVDKIISNYTQ